MIMLNNRIDHSVPLTDRWDAFRNNCGLVSPGNRAKHPILVVGSGLAGAAAAATLAEQGYRVKVFCLQDSPRRAHSVAAQGGINAAKNYQNDGDSVWRLFCDTIKGGDFRSRESNVYRLAQISGSIIDQCVAQGVPLAREYGGQLANRSFGGTLVSRTFYARGQTGQQLLLGAYGALMRQVAGGRAQILPRREMMDLVVVDNRARGIIVRNLVTGELESYLGDAVILASGGYSNIYYLSTNAKNSNASAAWRCHKRGAAFANPCFTQIHPTCIPVAGEHQSKLTLMSESLRNEGRLWVPQQVGDRRPAHEIPEAERDYFLERKYPTYGNLAPRDIASRSAKEVCDRGQGVSATGRAVYLDLRDGLARAGTETIAKKYGNLFDMYQKITGEDAYRVPMKIYPAVHYVMGGLWVDYGLMTTIPGLFAIGEANFSEHGANRLGASALMQGLGDGYFVISYGVGDYLAKAQLQPLDLQVAEPFRRAVQQNIDRLLAISGSKTATTFHRELGQILWEYVGMSRQRAGLEKAIAQITDLRQEFWGNLRLGGNGPGMNQDLELAGRVGDYLELGELMARDALDRQESCGAHFREEFQTSEGEAQRDDAAFAHVAVWEYDGEPGKHLRHQEPLVFENIQPSQRSYK
jgi:succinate dehydrogenase / fumarate reductase, flavoprotein subunit